MPSSVDDSHIGDPGTPIEGSDAGDADDLQKAYIEKVIRQYAQKAKQDFHRAQRLLSRGSRTAAEQFVDQALSNSAKAFWWSEDTDGEESQHILLHKIGRWKYQKLGCFLEFDGRQYHQKCLVAIAHKKMGTSIGYYGDRICSICDHDLSDCPHSQDRSYWVRGERDSRGNCRVCQKKKCDHSVDNLYRARVVGISINLVLEEVSFVRRPADPEARITDIPFSGGEMAAHFGSEFQEGMPVRCNACSGICPGFTEFQSPST
jgi:hypothetical protein